MSNTSNSQTHRPTIYVSDTGRCVGYGLHRYAVDLTDAEQQAVRDGKILIVRHEYPSVGTINAGTHYRQVIWRDGRFRYGLSSCSDAEIEQWGEPVPEPVVMEAEQLTPEELAERAKRKQEPIRDAGVSDK